MRLAALLIALALPSHAQTDAPKAPTGGWRVVELGGMPTTADDEVTLQFDATQVSGRAACNRFSAELRVEPVFGLGPLAMTRMLCPGRASELEALFVRLIGGVDGWRIDEGALDLLAGDQVILRAEAAPGP